MRGGNADRYAIHRGFAQLSPLCTSVAYSTPTQSAIECGSHQYVNTASVGKLTKSDVATLQCVKHQITTIMHTAKSSVAIAESDIEPVIAPDSRRKTSPHVSHSDFKRA